MATNEQMDWLSAIQERPVPNELIPVLKKLVVSSEGHLKILAQTVFSPEGISLSIRSAIFGALSRFLITNDNYDVSVIMKMAVGQLAILADTDCTLETVALFSDIMSACSSHHAVWDVVVPILRPSIVKLSSLMTLANANARPSNVAALIQLCKRLGVPFNHKEIMLGCSDARVVRTLAAMFPQEPDLPLLGRVAVIRVAVNKGNADIPEAITLGLAGLQDSCDGARKEAWALLVDSLKMAGKASVKLDSVQMANMGLAVIDELSDVQPLHLAECLALLDSLWRRGCAELLDPILDLPLAYRGKYAALTTILKTPFRPLDKIATETFVQSIRPALLDTTPASSLHVARFVGQLASVTDVAHRGWLVALFQMPIPPRIVQAAIRHSRIPVNTVIADLNTCPLQVGVVACSLSSLPAIDAAMTRVLHRGVSALDAETRHKALITVLTLQGSMTSDRIAVVLHGLRVLMECSGFTAPNRIREAVAALVRKVTPWTYGIARGSMGGETGIPITSDVDLAVMLTQAALDRLHPLNGLANQRAIACLLRCYYDTWPAARALIVQSWDSIVPALFCSVDAVREDLTYVLTLPDGPPHSIFTNSPMPLEAKLAALCASPEQADTDLYAGLLARRIIRLAQARIPVQITQIADKRTLMHMGAPIQIHWSVSVLPPVSTDCDVRYESFKSALSVLPAMVTRDKDDVSRIQATPGLIRVLTLLYNGYMSPEVKDKCVGTMSTIVWAMSGIVDSELTRPSDHDNDDDEYAGSVLYKKAWRCSRFATEFIVQLTEGHPTTELLDMFCAVLLKVRHIGAMKHTAQCLRRLVRNSKVSTEIHTRVNALVDLIQDGSPKLTLRRSSAGLPYLVTALLTADPLLAPAIVDRLVAIINAADPTRPGPAVHAMNVVNAIFLDGDLFKACASQLETVAVAATRALQVDQWRVKSGATQLFAHLTDRLVGKDLGTGQRASAATVFTRFPVLVDHCIDVLHKLAAKPATFGMVAVPCMHLITSVAVPVKPTMAASETSLRVFDAAWALLSHCSFHIRGLAVKICAKYSWVRPISARELAGEIRTCPEVNRAEALARLWATLYPTTAPPTTVATHHAVAAPLCIDTVDAPETPFGRSPVVPTTLSCAAQVAEYYRVAGVDFQQFGRLPLEHRLPFVTSLVMSGHVPDVLVILSDVASSSDPSAFLPALNDVCSALTLESLDHTQAADAAAYLAEIIIAVTFENPTAGSVLATTMNRLLQQPLDDDLLPRFRVATTLGRLQAQGKTFNRPTMALTQTQTMTCENATVVAQRMTMGDASIGMWLGVG
ncbi:putative death-receptor fusion protein (DUF2428) [Carpediemonas membranifera]|uniref:Putative death-receptor fusion protein (DUF2428) n=1 Tax=Carpediemonas membranifera TaxID=201153 RepID=A0A8J6AYG5_9EUKA|nr:putative death-receptor fusion protein (DUF2428) [Carpediemonas membranifera]|eukprot:KAG9395510.1 putative death-receptor fusion protein (DUF2428) [Carpediemonas membranifera]